MTRKIHAEKHVGIIFFNFRSSSRVCSGVLHVICGGLPVRVHFVLSVCSYEIKVDADPGYFYSKHLQDTL